MVNGKAKGSEFERDVCKALSKWVTDGKREDVFWRSAMSGGRATVSKGKVRQAGDITAVAPEGHKLTTMFYIECKHLKNISLDSFITRKGPLFKIWKDTLAKASEYDLVPMLIFRQNRWPTVVCTTHGGCSALSMHPGVFVASDREQMYLLLFEEMVSRILWWSNLAREGWEIQQ